MIQRIQTIYLLLAALALFVLLALPVGYQETESGIVVNVGITENIPTLVLSLLGGVISLVAIFLYKSRKLQLRITMIAILLSLLTLVSTLLFDYVTGTQLITSPNFIVLVMPVFSFVFNLLAYRGIDSDEKLVRSMDRLR